MGAGVGLPLGLAVLVALGLLWKQRKYRIRLEQRSDAWEMRYAALEKMKGLTYGDGGTREVGLGYRPEEDTRMRYQLHDTCINEADGAAHSNLYEMGGVR